MRNFKYDVGDKVVCSIFSLEEEKGEVIFVDVEASVDDPLVYVVRLEDSELDYWVAENSMGSDDWYIVGPADGEPEEGFEEEDES